MSLDNIDVTVFRKSFGFGPGKLFQPRPKNGIGSSRRDTAYYSSACSGCQVTGVRHTSIEEETTALGNCCGC
jgi:hypothetical protein